MARYSIIDPGWRYDAAGHAWFLAGAGLALYAWSTSFRPMAGSLPAAVAYYAILCAIAAVLGAILWSGFARRRTDAADEGLVIYEGYYGLMWRKRVIPKAHILAVERYDRLAVGFFGRSYCSGIRVRFSDGLDLVVAETDGQGRYELETAELRRTLGLAVVKGDALNGTGVV